MIEELIFHMSGDDHEERVYPATDEAQAREMCAADFNEQYDDDDAEYTGDEFDLLGVYRNPDHIDIDDYDFDDVKDSLIRLDTWPKGN